LTATAILAIWHPPEKKTFLSRDPENPDAVKHVMCKGCVDEMVGAIFTEITCCSDSVMARRINYPFILLTFIMRMPQRPILWSGIKLLLKRACAPP
jgi:hypothetical protein